MSLALSLHTLCELARITVPTFAEGITGRLSRETVDERCRSFARRILDRARVKLEVVGAEAIPLDRSYVYMSNHESHIDIPVLYCAVPSPTLRMVAKTELFRIPMWGTALREAGFVEVDRSNRTQAIASLKKAAEQMASGVSVWIAPEGSRTRTGELGPLKKGGFHLARAAGAPIVPVAISGTRQILAAGETSMNYDIPVRVVLGAPIESAGASIDELMRAVESFLRANVRRLGSGGFESGERRGRHPPS